MEGKEADHRTDIFAFGMLVYEMATGKRAFSGESQASLIAAILEHEPVAISTLQPVTPARLDEVVRTCLAKDPDDRWQGVGDVGRQLKGIIESGSQPGVSIPVTAATHSVTWQRALPWAGGIALAVALVIALSNLQTAPVLTPLSRATFTVSPPADISLPREERFLGAISPDGEHLVFVGQSADILQLYHRPLDQQEWVPIPGTVGATAPFFWPDGSSIGFKLGDTLRRMPLAGGDLLIIGTLPATGHNCEYGFAWSARSQPSYARFYRRVIEELAVSGEAHQQCGARLARRDEGAKSSGSTFGTSLSEKPQVGEIMKGYKDLVDGGYRQVFPIE